MAGGVDGVVVGDQMVDHVWPPSVLPNTPFGGLRSPLSNRESAINANTASWLEGATASAIRLMSAAGRPVVSWVHVGVAALALSVRYMPLPQNAHQARFGLLGS